VLNGLLGPIEELNKTCTEIVAPANKEVLNSLYYSPFLAVWSILHGHFVFFICHRDTFFYNEEWREDTESNKV
jgi:hypothetical protein